MVGQSAILSAAVAPPGFVNYSFLTNSYYKRVPSCENACRGGVVVCGQYHRSIAAAAAGFVCLMLILFPSGAAAGGPKYVAGSTFFDPAVMGRPVHWAG